MSWNNDRIRKRYLEIFKQMGKELRFVALYDRFAPEDIKQATKNILRQYEEVLARYKN